MSDPHLPRSHVEHHQVDDRPRPSRPSLAQVREARTGVREWLAIVGMDCLSRKGRLPRVDHRARNALDELLDVVARGLLVLDEDPHSPACGEVS